MKQYIYFFLLTLIFSGCSSDDSSNSDNNPPGLFSANNTAVTSTTASIEWTEAIDFDDDPVSYAIYLEGELVTTGLPGFTYQFTGLDPETGYDGYIEANDGKGGTSTANFFFLTEPELLIFNITDDIDWIHDSFPEAGGIRQLWRTGFEIPFYQGNVTYNMEVIDYRYGFNNDEPCPCIGTVYTWTNETPHPAVSFVGDSQRFSLNGTTVNTLNPNYDMLLEALDSYFGEVQVIITIED